MQYALHIAFTSCITHCPETNLKTKLMAAQFDFVGCRVII